MENPAYWTELHWQIFRECGHGERADKVARVVKLLMAEGYAITEREVAAQFDAADKAIKEIVCGPSLPSRIISYLDMRGERS